MPPSSSKPTTELHTPTPHGPSTFLPLLYTLASSAWLFLLLATIAWLNQQTSVTLVLSFLLPFLLTLLCLLISRLRYLLLLLPIALAPASLIALAPPNGYTIFAVANPTTPSSISSSLTPSAPLPSWLFLLLTASLITYLIATSKLLSPSPNHHSLPIDTNQYTIPHTDHSNALSVQRFIRLWQWILIALWALPSFALFFEERMILQFHSSFGENATIARIAGSLVLFFVWLGISLSSFLMPVQSLTYYPILIRREPIFQSHHSTHISGIHKRLGFFLTLTFLVLLSLLFHWFGSF